MSDCFIDESGVKRLLGFLSGDFDVYVIGQKDENLSWKKFAPEEADHVVIGRHRCAEPLKSFTFKPKEKVLDGLKSADQKAKPIAVIGAKACDLRAFKILDYVFMEGDFKDPFYIQARQENLIVSSDCTSFKDTCFCLALGVEPFPKENFDINFAEADGGFIVTVGSERGRAVLQRSGVSAGPVSGGQKAAADKDKEGFLKRLEAGILSMALPPKDFLKQGVRKSFKAGLWSDFAGSCVECGGCNTVCPTCHCFLLTDQRSDDRHQRLKVWDSCLLKGFAKVAGGANPRKRLNERLRNRFIKKFDYFPEVLGEYACTGCGRCVEACPGGIDLREVLKEACEAAAKSAQ